MSVRLCVRSRIGVFVVYVHVFGCLCTYVRARAQNT